MVSAYARRGHVDHTTIDFTSQLKFIENNWRVKPLASRDAAANDITSAFDFDAGPREPVLLSEQRNVPPPPPSPAAMVYGLYGGALGIPLLLLATGGLIFRLRIGSAVSSARRGT